MSTPSLWVMGLGIFAVVAVFVVAVLKFGIDMMKANEVLESEEKNPSWFRSPR